jgi:hypothetical protein
MRLYLFAMALWLIFGIVVFTIAGMSSPPRERITVVRAKVVPVMLEGPTEIRR